MLRYSHASLAAGVALVGLSATPAAGQAPLDKLVQCREISDDRTRLACLDRELGTLIGAVDRKDIVVMDRSEVRQSRRKLFGLSLDKVSLFGGLDKGQDEPDEIVTTVATIRELGYGKYRFTTQDEGVWETTESGRAPRVGKTAVIRKGAMGGYFFRADGGRSVRARRVQ